MKTRKPYKLTARGTREGISLIAQGRVIHRTRFIRDAEAFASGWYGKPMRLFAWRFLDESDYAREQARLKAWAGAPATEAAARPPIAWHLDVESGETRERSAIVRGVRLHVWRVEAGSWAWGASARTLGASHGRVTPCLYGAPSVTLAKRDAEAWAEANAAHMPQGRPPVAPAFVDSRVQWFLANPGAAPFMCAPSARQEAEARDMLARARARAYGVQGVD